MESFTRIIKGLRSLLRREAREAELDAEIRHHIDLETEKNVAGMLAILDHFR